MVAEWIQSAAEHWQAVPPLVRASLSPVAVIAAAVGGLFLPCPLHWLALSDPKKSSAFLAEAWAVTGASLGFAVVLVVFAYQTVATTRSSSGVRDLAKVAPLLFVLYLGIAAIVVDGLVLLDVGYQAPARWAASWATSLSGVAVVMLAFLIAASMRAVDPQVLQKRRVAQVRRRAIDAINADAVERLALSLLISDGERAGYEVSPLESAGLPRKHMESARPGKRGVIADIRLDRLRRVARECARSGLPPPVITAVFARAVGDLTRLAFFPEGLNAAAQHLLISAFKIGRTAQDPQSLLVAAADELHQEAMQAIDAGRAAAFQEACTAQEELLLAFPEAWSRLGQSFTAELASGMFPLTTGALDPLGRHLYEQAMRATREGEREITDIAVGLPLTIAVRAVPLNAHALSDRMLLVLGGIASATRGSPPGSLDQQANSSALNHVSSYISYIIFPRVGNEDIAYADRLEAVKFLSGSAGALADMMREAAELGDFVFFDDAVTKWREFGQLWLYADDYREDEDSPMRAAQDVLDRLRFVLCAWLLRRLWTDPRDSARSRAFVSLATFDDVKRIFDVAAMPLGDPASWRLSNWILSSLPTGQAHAIDTATPIVRALVITALRLDPQPGLTLRPSRWILDNAGSILDVITKVETASELTAAVASPNVAAVADVLRAAVREASARQETLLDDELIRASLDDVRVQAFTAAVRESWAKQRIAANLLRLAGASEDVAHNNPDARFGHQDYAPKDLFVGDRVGGLESYAQQIGNVIARRENSRLYEAIGEARGLRRSAGDINQRLDHAIDAMCQKGYRPTTLFVPWRVWQLPQDLDLQAPAEPRDEGGAIRGMLGRFRELDVIEMRTLPDDRVVVADLRAFAAFRQWTGGDEALTVTVTSFDEEAAETAARSNRRLLRQPGRTKLADRARELRKLVFVEAIEEFALEVTDRGAARAMLLPPTATPGSRGRRPA